MTYTRHYFEESYLEWFSSIFPLILLIIFCLAVLVWAKGLLDQYPGSERPKPNTILTPMDRQLQKEPINFI